MDVHRRLSLNMQALRRQKAWSQEELADQCDLHRTYISGVERGIRNPTLTVLEKIAVGLGVSIGDLTDKAPADT